MIADLIGLALLLMLGLGLGYSPVPHDTRRWLIDLGKARLAPLMALIALSMLLGWASIFAQYGLAPPPPSTVEHISK